MRCHESCNVHCAPGLQSDTLTVNSCWVEVGGRLVGCRSSAGVRRNAHLRSGVTTTAALLSIRILYATISSSAVRHLDPHSPSTRTTAAGDHGNCACSRRRRSCSSLLRTPSPKSGLAQHPLITAQGRAGLVALRRSRGSTNALGKAFYKGGFEKTMNRREAALILETS